MLQSEILIAFRKNGGNDLLITSSSDGVTWGSNTLLNQATYDAPSICGFNGKLYVAFKAADTSNSILVTSSSDGVTWDTNNVPVGQLAQNAPAVCWSLS